MSDQMDPLHPDNYYVDNAPVEEEPEVTQEPISQLDVTTQADNPTTAPAPPPTDPLHPYAGKETDAMVNPYAPIAPTQSWNSPINANESQSKLNQFLKYAKRTGIEVDSNEEFAKLNMANYFAESLGLSIEHAYSNYDAVSKAYFGVATPPRSAWQSVVDEGRAARDSTKASLMSYSLMAHGDIGGEDYDNKMDRYMRFIGGMKQYDNTDQPAWAKVLGAGASFMPSMGVVLWHGLLGAGLAAPTGQATTGAKIGSAYGGFKLAGGAIYGDIMTTLIPNEEGPDQTLYEAVNSLPEGQRETALRDLNKIATGMSAVGGIISAGVEMVGVERLAKGSKMLRTIVAEAGEDVLEDVFVSRILSNRVAAFVAAYGLTVAENVLQEMVQETTEWGAAELTRRVYQHPNIGNIPQQDLEDWETMVKDVAANAAMGGLVIGLPGSVKGGSRVAAIQKRFIDDGATVINTRDIADLEEAITQAEMEVAQDELDRGDAQPVNVYIDETGKHIPADRRAEAIIGALGEEGIDDVPVNIVEGPLEEDDDVQLDEEELDYDDEEVVEVRDEADIIAEEDEVQPTAAEGPITAPEPQVTSVVDAQRTARGAESRADVTARWNEAKVKGKLTQEWKKQFGETSGFTQSAVNGVTRMAEKFAEYLGLSTDEFIDRAFMPEAFARINRFVDPNIVGQAVFDPAQEDRARIIFTDISNPTTAVHEFAHVMRRYIKDDHKQALQDHYGNNFWNETGPRPTQDQVLAEERFAEDFERYMADGIAPTEDLKGVFARLSKMIRDLVQAIRPAITPEARRVFDEMFGKDAGLAAMERDLALETTDAREQVMASVKKVRAEHAAMQKMMDQKYSKELAQDNEADSVAFNQSVAQWEEGLGRYIDAKEYSTDLVGAEVLANTGDPEAQAYLAERRKEMGLNPDKKNSVSEVARILTENTADSHGRDMRGMTDEDAKFLGDRIAAETAWAIDNSRKNAIGWYDSTLGKAMNLYSKFFPELKDDVGSQFVFKAGLAVTSQGIDVLQNGFYGLKAYKHYRKTGRFIEKGWGKSADSMAGNFRDLNSLVDVFDGDFEGIARFMTTYYKVSDLQQLGYNVGGELVGSYLPGSAILGPKIGSAFFSNLFGNYEMTTMDLWYTRTMGRHMGTLLESGDLDKQNEQRQILMDRIKEMSAADFNKNYGEGVRNLETGDMITKLSRKYKKTEIQNDMAALNEWAEDTRKAVNRAGVILTKQKVKDIWKTKIKDETQQFAKKVAEYKGALKGTPSGGSERAFFRKAMDNVVKTLADNGYGAVTHADIQAAMWYYEKDLYGSLGGTNKTAKPADYYDAAKEYTKDEQHHSRRTASSSRQREPGQAGDIPARERGNRQGAIDWDSRLAPPGNQRHPESGQGPYTRRDIRGSAQLGLLTGDTVKPVAVYTPNGEYTLFANQTWARIDEKSGEGEGTGPAPYPYFELDPADGPSFQNAIVKAKTENKRTGFLVDAKSVDDYRSGKYRLFLTEDGSSGFAVGKEDGDIVSVFSSKQGPRGAAHSMIPIAIQTGGRRLDCFDTDLPYIYGQFGFLDNRRMTFNDEIVKADIPDWDYASPAITPHYPDGRPDVLFMSLEATVTKDGWLGYENYKDIREGRKQKRGTYDRTIKTSEYTEDWGEGVAAQNEYIDGVTSFNQTLRPAEFVKPLEDTQYQENLMNWFGESAVYDQARRPLTVYHAAGVSIGLFDPEQSKDSNSWGAGVYFAEDPTDASDNYASTDGPDIQAKLRTAKDKYVMQTYDYPERLSDSDVVRQLYKDTTGEEVPPKGQLEFWIQGHPEQVSMALATDEVLGAKNVHSVHLKMETPFDENEMSISVFGREGTGGGTELHEYISAMRALGFEEDTIESFAEDIEDFGAEELTGIELKEIFEGTMQSAEFEMMELFDTEWTTEAFRQLVQHMGFDGAIQYPANYRWGSWSQSRRHFIMFEGGSKVKSSYNVGSWDESSPYSFNQSISHEKAVKKAVSEGRPISDNVLEDYKDRPWASGELKRRTQLRGDFQWIMPIAEQAESWEELKATVEAEYAEDAPKGKVATDLFYKRAFGMATATDAENSNKAFLDSMQSREALQQFIRDLGKDPEAIKGMGMHRRVMAMARRGKISTPADLAVLQSLIARKPAVYRRALATVNKDAAALDDMAYERDTAVLEADIPGREEISPANRINVAASMTDPELQKMALTGEFTGADAKRMTKKLYAQRETLQGEVAAAEADVARAKEGTKKKAQTLENLREKNRLVVENRKAIADVKKMRNYRLKLAKQIGRSIPKSVDIEARIMVEQVRDGFKGRFESAEAKAKRNNILALLELDPALKATMKPSELKRLTAKPLDEWTVAELEDMSHRVTTLIQIGKRIKSERDRIRKDQIKNDAGQGAADTLDQTPAEDIKGVGSREAEAVRQGKTSNPLSKPWGSVERGSFRPPRVFRMLFGEDSPMYDWFVRKVNTATDATLSMVDRRKQGIDALQKKLGLTERMLSEDVTVDGMTYTKDQIVHMYIAQKNDRSRVAIQYGNGITEIQMKQFLSQISPQMKQWGDALLKEFDNNYTRLRAAHRRIANEDMGQEDFYFPMLRLGVLQQSLDEEIKDMMETRSAWGNTFVNKKFTMSRVDPANENQAAIKLGATSVWYDQVEKQEHYINSGQLVKDLHSLRLNKALRAAITQKHGDDWNRWMEKYVNDFANPSIYKALDGPNKLFKLLRSNYALGALALNALTMVKQIPSIVLFLSRVGPAKLMAQAARVTIRSEFKKMEAFVDAMDPQMKQRALQRYMEELKERTKTGKKSYVRGIANFGMKPIQMIDKRVTVAGWMAVYEDHVARGFTEAQSAQAAQMAVLETQPSGRAKDLAELYRGNEAQNWFTMFSNQINQIWNMAAADIPYAVKEGNYMDATGIVAGMMINMSVMILLSGWRPPEDEEELAGDLSSQYLKQLFNIFPLVGPVISSGMSQWGYSGINAFPLGESVGRFSAFIFSSDKDRESYMRELERIGKDAALQFGIPSVFLGRAWKAGEEIAEQDYWDALGQMFGPAFKEEIARNE